MENEDKKNNSVESEVVESTEEVMQEADSPAVDQTIAEESHDVVEETEKEDESHEVIEEKTETTDEKVEEEKVEEKKKKKGKGPLIILLFLILCIGVGCAYYFFVMNRKVESTKIENKPKEVKSKYRMSGNSLEDFDLYFLKLENEEKNKVYSPLSIKYAMEMLSEGANGETKNQLDAVIGDYKAKKYNNNEHMSFANAIFIRNTFKDSIKSDYVNNLTNKYSAEVIYDEFASPDNINNWVSNKTFNLVNNLVDDVSKNQFFLINALAIDMNWNNQIHCAMGHNVPCNGTYYINYKHEKLDEDATDYYSNFVYPYEQEDDFYGNSYQKQEFNGKEFTKGGTIYGDFNKYDIVKDLGEDKIKEMIRPEYLQWLQTEDGKNASRTDFPLDVEEYLNKFINELKENYGKSANSTDFFVNETEKEKVFAKDLQTYDGQTLQYIGIMPKNVELAEFIKSSDKNSLTKLINGLQEVKIESFEEGYVTRIRGFIPFFKFEYELQLLNDLKKLGIKDVFDDSKADLSNLTSKSGIYIDKAIHKANIEFSNDGIKAAAATTFGGFGSTHGPQFEHLFKVPVKEIDVTFDKPYMYLVRDKDSGEVWFAGTVYEPIQK